MVIVEVVKYDEKVWRLVDDDRDGFALCDHQENYRKKGGDEAKAVNNIEVKEVEE